MRGELAQEAAAAGETVVSLGGDGLAGALAGALRGSAPLGVLPGGRGNDFARALGIPQDLGRGLPRRCSTASERRLDLGEANGRPFACIASIGYDSVANRIANEARLDAGQPRLRLRRDPGAGALAARALPGPPRRRRARVRGLHAGRRQLAPTTAAACRIAPAADPADGLLDVVFIEADLEAAVRR